MANPPEGGLPGGRAIKGRRAWLVLKSDCIWLRVELDSGLCCACSDWLVGASFGGKQSNLDQGWSIVALEQKIIDGFHEGMVGPGPSLLIATAGSQFCLFVCFVLCFVWVCVFVFLGYEFGSLWKCCLIVSFLWQ